MISNKVGDSSQIQEADKRAKIPANQIDVPTDNIDCKTLGYGDDPETESQTTRELEDTVWKIWCYKINPSTPAGKRFSKV